MGVLFLNLLKISALCSLGILLVLAVSPLLGKKHTVFWRYLLWIVFAVRLVLPFDFSIVDRAVIIPVPNYLKTRELENSSDDFGGMQAGLSGKKGYAADEEREGTEKIQADKTEREGTEKIQTDKAKEGGKQKIQADGEEERNGAETIRTGRTEENDLQPDAGSVKFSVDVMIQAAAFLWAAVAVVLAVWQMVCYGIFCHRLKKTKVFLTENQLPVYCSSLVLAPVLVGMRKPEIFLPCQEYDAEQINFILEHELTHYKRKDLWVKLLLVFAGTIHWFNPFAAIMVRQAEKDIELLCDSRVVKNFTREEKKKYSEILLACAALKNNRKPRLCTSEFSRDAKSLKERFSNIFSGRKKKGIFAAAFGMGILFFVSFFVAFGMPKRENSGKDQMLPVKEKEDFLEQKMSELSGLSMEEAASAVYGAVFPRLIYASDERAVLYDYWGLLIYNIKSQKIEQLLNLKAADLAYIQGDKVTHIEVSKDGAQILLYNEPHTAERFIYDIDEQKLAYTDLDSFGKNSFAGLFADGEQNYVLTEQGKAAYLSADSLRTEDGGIFHETDMCGLSLIVGENTKGNAQIYPLFSEFYEEQKETAILHLKRENIRRLVGKEFLYTDEEGWNYYLEEDKDKESPLWEVAEILEPLLLTRYKEKERQVLENLIYQETWQESPVLFAGGRIVYQAAKTADIIGIKECTLVSIALDGSDRKTADEIMYRTFDGLCEDNGWLYYSGWTNDGIFPKPLCRIAPDFSGGPQFVEDIPGVLCGVKDGYVYYLAAEGKKAGMWKQNLTTGEEIIYDKWGESAENMTFLYTGENKDAGCHVIFSYDFEDEIYAVDVPF